jgi:peptide deformylase
MNSLKIISITILALITLPGCSNHQTRYNQLPNYVAVNDSKTQDLTKELVLKRPAKLLNFPLSREDIQIIKTLEAKFDNEENCAGLAAPQIGFDKQVIVFAVENKDDLKKWRPDLSDTMPKTIWINPSYQPINQEKHVDYESCFSVNDLIADVPRYKKIKYKAFLPSGEKIEGIATGFLARVIQHEIDHVKGTLFIDRVSPSKVVTIEEYKKQRARKKQATN